MTLRTRRSGPELHATFVLVLAITTCLGTPSPALAAQDHLLPSPISMRHLDQYAKRLNLGLAQWKATLDQYEAYRDAYNAYRVNTIDAYYDGITPVNEQTNREAYEWFRENNDHIKAFRRKLQQIDEVFFQTIESTLIEAQRLKMQGLRDHRTRQYMYFAENQMSRSDFLRYKAPDLSELVRAMKPSRHEMKLLEPVLSPYERRLTILTNQVTNLCISRYQTVFKRLVDLGLGDENSTGEENLKQVQFEYRKISKGRQSRNLFKSVHELNRSMARQLEEIFTGDRHEEWLDRYTKLMYSYVYSYRSFRKRLLQTLEQIENPTDEEAALLEELKLEILRRTDQVIQECRTASDLYWNPAVKPDDLQPRWAELVQVWRSSGTKIVELRDWTISQLKAGLSKSRFSLWEASYPLYPFQDRLKAKHTSGQSVQLLYKAPINLSAHDLRWIKTSLRQDEESFEQFESLWASYQAWNETRDVREAGATTYQDGPLQTVIVQRQLQRERIFFDTVRTLLDDESLSRMIDWVRHIRERQLWSRNLSTSGPANIDPISFLLDADLSPDLLEQIADQVDEFKREANERYRLRYEAALHVFRERKETGKRRNSDDKNIVLSRELALFNDQAMRDLISQFPDALKTSLLDTYHRAAHPFLFQDKYRLHHVFQRPVLIESISEEQHRLILDLQSEYISQYTELTDDMIELATDAESWMSRSFSGKELLVPYRDHGVIEEYAPLRYERDELNASTNLKIRTILTPTQVEAIGGLPDLD